MSKQIIALFLLVNCTLLTVTVTPSKLILLLLVSITVLKIYKTLWGYRYIDKFKATEFSHRSSESVTVKLVGAFLHFLSKSQCIQKNVTVIGLSLLFLGLSWLFSSQTVMLCIFNFFFLMQLMVSLNIAYHSSIKRKLGIIKTKSVDIYQDEYQSFLVVPKTSNESKIG